MDQFGRKLREYLRAGADPRRASAGPTLRGGRDVSESAHVRTIAATSLFGAFGGFLIGCLVILVIIAAIAAIMDLRPARQTDIAIAARVRAAIPNPENLNPNDLTARLAVPPSVSLMVAPLIDLDPDHEAPGASWLAAISGHSPLVVDPGRVRALARMAITLSQSKHQQEDLDFVVELYQALHNDDAIAILRAIVDLPPGHRTELAQTDDLPRILEQIAEIPRTRRHDLLGAGLSAVLPTDPNRANLLRILPTLDSPVVNLILRWSSVRQTQRQVLIFVLGKIEMMDPSFAKLLGAFYVGNSTLQRALKSIRTDCGYTDLEACR